MLSGPMLALSGGCTTNADCQNGGACTTGTCLCAAGWYGPDCTQPRSRALCNGLGAHIEYESRSDVRLGPCHLASESRSDP